LKAKLPHDQAIFPSAWRMSSSALHPFESRSTIDVTLLPPCQDG
jgi:hypothetical protein